VGDEDVCKNSSRDAHGINRGGGDGGILTKKEGRAGLEKETKKRRLNK
jgi:hypothetical protein